MCSASTRIRAPLRRGMGAFMFFRTNAARRRRKPITKRDAPGSGSACLILRFLIADDVGARMAVLVTGGGGFVGLNLVEALLARGEEVILFDNGPLPAPAQRALSRYGRQLNIAP
ncbi:MAG TPA: NAD-dependent epimerase/dehydratase family protein, partial [Burkholderiales bacterium]|nr:NAD-dependent epimerase/dehydratase family protein [Burkholderiales bacterium]